MTEVHIDLNVRVRHNWTFAGFEDVYGPLPGVGDTVRVVEPESGISGSAIVATIDHEKRLIYLDVPWRELR